MNLARLASLTEMQSDRFVSFTRNLESFAASLGLDKEIRYCRRWEYPWIWFNGLERASYPMLDIGSALSPMPWFLAQNGMVTLTDIDPSFTDAWKRIGRTNIDWQILSNESIPFASESFSTVISFSVVEHQSDKDLALSEMIRVLKHGGLLALSFDLFEPSFGMHYPRTDLPLSLMSFESIWFHPAFGNDGVPDWNLADIPSFLQWHSTTAPQHTYVAGAAVLTKL